MKESIIDKEALCRIAEESYLEIDFASALFDNDALDEEGYAAAYEIAASRMCKKMRAELEI